MRILPIFRKIKNFIKPERPIILKNYNRYIGPEKPINYAQNPSTIGWIRPDLKINFSSEEVAKTYAKNRSIQALKEKEPFERGLAYKQNVILMETDGNAKSCQIDDSIYEEIQKTRGVNFVHGHPDFYGPRKTMPLSEDDIGLFIDLHLDSITAYNSKGEFNTIQNPNNIKLNHTDFYRFILKQSLPLFLASKERLECLNLLKGNLSRKELNKFYGFVNDITSNLSFMVKNNPHRYANIRHKDYIKYAKENNLIYKTNFSNLG